MKKALFILTTILMVGLVSSCSKDDDVSLKKNWLFTVTSVTTMSPDDSGIGPITDQSTVEQDGLTETEAETLRKSLESTQSQSIAGVTITIKVTATKEEKK